MNRHQLKTLERRLYGRAPAPLAKLSDEDLHVALDAVTSGKPIPHEIEQRIDEALLRLPRDPVLARLTDKQLRLALEMERPR